MKKYFCVVLALFLIIGLTACGGGIGGSQNEIGATELSADQKEIVDMISIGERGVHFFDYQAEESCKQAEFWVELYKDGVSVERPVETIMDGENYSRSGRVAFILNDETNYKWDISTRADSLGTYVQGREITLPGITGLSNSAGFMDPATIEKGKEIVLYSMVLSSDGSFESLSSESLETEPDILKKYAFVFLLKCKFD